MSPGTGSRPPIPARTASLGDAAGAPDTHRRAVPRLRPGTTTFSRHPAGEAAIACGQRRWSSRRSRPSPRPPLAGRQRVRIGQHAERRAQAQLRHGRELRPVGQQHRPIERDEPRLRPDGIGEDGDVRDAEEDLGMRQDEPPVDQRQQVAAVVAADGADDGANIVVGKHRVQDADTVFGAVRDMVARVEGVRADPDAVAQRLQHRVPAPCPWGEWLTAEPRQADDTDGVAEPQRPGLYGVAVRQYASLCGVQKSRSGERLSWYAWQDSNLRPLGPQPNALSPELQAHSTMEYIPARGRLARLPGAAAAGMVPGGEGGIRTLDGSITPILA